MLVKLDLKRKKKSTDIERKQLDRLMDPSEDNDSTIFS